MDLPAEDLTRPGAESALRRPRDLTLLLLAIGTGPPRARARDQQADIAGGLLRRRVLDRLASLDPEPDELDATLTAIVAELGEPTGPTRAAVSLFRQEWDDALHTPGYWSWLLAEALGQSSRREGSRGTP
jgi:hypothetical protein